MDGRQLLQDDEQPVGFDWSKLFAAKPSEIAIRLSFTIMTAITCDAPLA